jgi:hypothetical protein
MSEMARNSDDHTVPRLSLRMKILFFVGDPLVALGLLVASILVAITGTVTRWPELTLCGIVFALAAVALFTLVLLMGIETLIGWSREIAGKLTDLHDEELQKLSATQRPPSTKLGSLFKN